MFRAKRLGMQGLELRVNISPSRGKPGIQRLGHTMPQRHRAGEDRERAASVHVPQGQGSHHA